jgi:hypothetical protein
MATLAVKLAALQTLSPAQLRIEWQRVYGAVAPTLSAELLVHGIAYRLQEKVLGKLPARVARSIQTRSSAPRIKPGTQLVRSWNGRSVAVVVTDSGYLFEERPYRSLTAIAREVTGAGWSGPRFFGIADHG